MARMLKKRLMPCIRPAMEFIFNPAFLKCFMKEAKSKADVEVMGQLYLFNSPSGWSHVARSGASPTLGSFT
eukprot:5445844-Prorocentrum_lima.AAC.1